MHASVPLGRIVDINPGPEHLADEVSFIPMEAIGTDGSLNLDARRASAEVRGGYVYLAEGDLIVAKVTPCYENGKAAVARGLHNGQAFATTEVYTLRPRAGVDVDFLAYALQESSLRSAWVGNMTGSHGVKRVPSEVVRSSRVALPTLAEQRTIAAFLDRETTEIDALVRKQESLIETLRERRAVAIAEAVTSGGHPAAAISRVASVVLGKTLQSEPRDGDDVFAPYLRAAHIQPNGKVIDLGDEQRMWFRRGDLAALNLLAGDVVVVEGGAGYGRSAFLRDDLPGWGFQNHVIRLRARPEVADGRYLDYAIQERYSAGVIEVACGGATIPQFSGDKAARLPISIPPLDEQRRIADYLDEQTAETDSLIAKAEQFIALAKERRAAIISAAVTGQIDCTHLIDESEVA